MTINKLHPQKKIKLFNTLFFISRVILNNNMHSPLYNNLLKIKVFYQMQFILLLKIFCCQKIIYLNYTFKHIINRFLKCSYKNIINI